QQQLNQSASRNGQLEERTLKMQQLEESLHSLQQDKARLMAENASIVATFEQHQRATNEKLAMLEQAKSQLADAFKALSADALSANNQSFLLLAKNTLGQFQEAAQVDLLQRQKSIHEMLTPVQQTLKDVDGNLKEMEKERASSYLGLRQQVVDLIVAQKELRNETGNLVKALRTPHVRGQWGEMQLKRVVEIAGMLPRCDFIEQGSVEGDKGRIRPDMVINLPGNRTIIVDAKAPLAAYLDALEAPDETTRQEFLADHARQVRSHIRSLSQRAYWDQFPSAPDFVILFLPGETFFSAALEKDPSLIESGVRERVILATPTTLIALLRAVSYGWRQETIALNTQLISDLGRDLYKRLHDLGSHLSRVGKSLGTAVESYNHAVGTLERRVLVTARKFQTLDTNLSQEDLAQTPGIDATPRSLSAPELLFVPEEAQEVA
ncbi:MAG: DNA recombination protein RmuC, partial [Alphaproteobacteria bacterium]